VASAVPFVRPSEYECTSATGLEARSDLPVQGPRLGPLAMPPAIESQLRNYKWSIARNVVQTRQLGFEALS